MSLLSLPYDIRLQIWSHLFTDSVIRIYRCDFDFYDTSPSLLPRRPPPTRASRDDSHFPWQITATCRSLKEECTPLLSQATIYWHDLPSDAAVKSRDPLANVVVDCLWCVPAGYRQYITLARVSKRDILFDSSLFPALEVVQIADRDDCGTYYVEDAEEAHDLIPVNCPEEPGEIIERIMDRYGDAVRAQWADHRAKAALRPTGCFRLEVLVNLCIQPEIESLAVLFMDTGGMKDYDSAYSVLRRFEAEGVKFTMICSIDSPGLERCIDTVRSAYAYLVDNMLPSSALLQNIGCLSRPDAVELGRLFDRATRLRGRNFSWPDWPTHGDGHERRPRWRTLTHSPPTFRRTELDNKKAFFGEDFLRIVMGQ